MSWRDCQVDHVMPRADGGSDTDDNLRASHGACNRRRARVVHWQERPGRRPIDGPRAGALLRIDPAVYETVKVLARQRERSANWVMARLLRKAVSEDAAWLEDALGQRAT